LSLFLSEQSYNLSGKSGNLELSGIKNVLEEKLMKGESGKCHIYGGWQTAQVEPHYLGQTVV